MGRLTALVLGSAAGETFLNRFSLPDMPLGMGEQRTLKWLAIGLCHVEIFGGPIASTSAKNQCCCR
jgi:hypothetical protein